MSRSLKHSAKQAGLAPGTLVHVGKRKRERARIRITEFDEQDIKVIEDAGTQQALESFSNPRTTWIDVEGIHDLELVQSLGGKIGLHGLILEDIVNTSMHPKCEEHGDFFFIALKSLSFDEESNQAGQEQVSLVVGDRFVMTFQEGEVDHFEPVRARLSKPTSKIRSAGAGYLAYALIDAIVDSYFVGLEKIGELLEELEDELSESPTEHTLHSLHRLKRELIIYRKALWPLREVIVALRKEDSVISEHTGEVYLRDLLDHSIHALDTVDSYRDFVSSLTELYLSSISHRMNRIMQTLTTVATIFIPLTFIAGLYGMNFDFMPELKWPWGYPLALGVMVAIGLTMFICFKRNKWL